MMWEKLDGEVASGVALGGDVANGAVMSYKKLVWCS